MLLFCALSRDASAQAVGPPIVSPSAPRSEEPARHGWVASLDVLGALTRRIGVQLEYLVTPQDGVAFYPWVLGSDVTGTHDFLGIEPDFTLDTRTSAAGLDFQYRHYLGSNAGRGFFVAPGFEAQYFDAETSWTCAAYESNHDSPCMPPQGAHQEFGYLGPSFDIGGQGVLRSGLVLAASLGVHYRAVIGSLDDRDMPFLWMVTEGAGLRPRLRLSVGWAWL